MNAQAGKHKKIKLDNKQTMFYMYYCCISEIISCWGSVYLFATMSGYDFIMIHGEIMKEVKQSKVSLTTK